MTVSAEEFRAWLVGKEVRHARVNVRGHGPEAIAAYLPSNYQVTGTEIMAGDEYALITGVDIAGFTLDDYVIPRLASGLYFAEETKP